MTDHAARSHKRFAASAAERWFNCPGSMRLCDRIEERPSKYAEEGTRAHEWLQFKLIGGAKPVHEFTAEIEDAVAVFKEEAKKIPGPINMIVEQQASVRGTAAGDDVGGTADFGAFNPELRKMWLLDFKFGAGIAVEATNNKQLRSYDLSLMDTYGWNPIEIENVIVQPRAFHPLGPVRRENLLLADLCDFRWDLDEAVARCLEPDAPLIPGEEQCRWCPAKTICPALESRALALAGGNFTSVQQITAESLSAVNELTPDRIGRILAMKGVLEGWLKAVEEEAYCLAISGVAIPGRKLVQAIGRRSWDDEDDAVALKLAEIVPNSTSSEFLVTKLIGVTEAEKKVKAGVRAAGGDIKKALEYFAFLTAKQSSGKLQLVSDDDRRPAVSPTSEAFAGVVQLPYIGETE